MILTTSFANSVLFRSVDAQSLSKMIVLLEKYFPRGTAKSVPANRNLSISYNEEGSMLTHTHERHFQYVLESLTLWRNIMQEMFHLWGLVEEDFLDMDRGTYRYVDTGQGYNRMQSAPRVGSAMFRILGKTKRELGGIWIGSSVVHLGDRDVPNALVFLDKYTQVPRIINPILLTIEGIDDLMTRAGMKEFVESAYGSAEDVKMMILRDFFRHGFDGSGDDGGSCIDGRLTSAWNWCSKLSQKKYYPAFQLTGFTSFDGTF